ncbi:MAG: hypothetical protein HWN66_00440 [Candidatus Helarchaeota archaeon]|nr:hypothetical protein [Candidatus Helarchaeota archaeon]
MVHTYGELSDDLYVKPYLPVLSFFWRVFKQLGWEGVDTYEAIGSDGLFSFFETRLNESISTFKAVIEGEISDPDKVLSYTTIVPPLAIRSDLVVGMQKLFGGDSVDFTFAIVHDYNAELLILVNCHIEDGIPVDWYLIRQEDELLERRHMKYGYKLREIPCRVKTLNKAALYLKDVLRDVRNERTPQWANSDYFVGTVIAGWGHNLLYIPSNYESLVETFQGWASKEIYGLPDFTFGLHPFPSAFYMFFYQGRKEFCKKLASLSSNMNFYIQPFEPRNLKLVQDRIPHLYKIYKDQIENEGVPFPIQTINFEYPILKKKDPNIRFTRKYPEGDFLKPTDIGLTLEEFQNGVYLDVNHETPAEKIDESKIISLGIGRNTVFK